jgi:hypothetical protein
MRGPLYEDFRIGREGMQVMLYYNVTPKSGHNREKQKFTSEEMDLANQLNQQIHLENYSNKK